MISLLTGLFNVFYMIGMSGFEC